MDVPIVEWVNNSFSRRYIYSLLQPSTNVMRKRITFERSEQRADVAKKIKQEAEQLQGFFRKVGGDMADFDSPFKGCMIAYLRFKFN